MRPDRRFLNQPKRFWANVRFISQQIGYTRRGAGQIQVPEFDRIRSELAKAGLTVAHLCDKAGKPTPLGQDVHQYFRYRAHILNKKVEPLLMTTGQARKLFDTLRRTLRPKCPLPMNKQKGKKRAPAYLTGIVNMLIEANAAGRACDYDPRGLTIVTKRGVPVRTLARRVDGAFPSIIDPVAIWEIKEYYHTTTFGSRVADGVYESLLDGLELEEVRRTQGIHILHYLIVDAHYTWWDCGRSYLCRIIDMLHMGYVDEVLFGSEVVTRLPKLVREWGRIAKARSQHGWSAHSGCQRDRRPRG